MSNNEGRLYEFGEFRLDPAERLLSRRGVNVPLTPKAADLLVVLVEQPGRLLDKDTVSFPVKRTVQRETGQSMMASAKT